MVRDGFCGDNGAGIQKVIIWPRSFATSLHICHLFGMN